MKAGIHPEYVETTITCACGEVIHTRSTKQHIRIEICSKCHPFFSGKQKFIDTAGRIEKFDRKYKDVTPVVKPKKQVEVARVIKLPPAPKKIAAPPVGKATKGAGKPQGKPEAAPAAKAADKGSAANTPAAK